MIYRGMDQAALDAQYNLREAVPDHATYFADWAARSEAVRRADPRHLDLAFGDGPTERLDFFAARQPAAPLLAFIHGGFWRAMDKNDFSYPAPSFVAQDIAFASINYTLAPAASLDEIVAQSRRAVAWLARNAERLGVDKQRIFVAGHSAGGHLTAMLMLTDWRAFGLADDPVRGGCAISGVFDLEPVRLSYLGPEIGLDPAAAQRNSPLSLVAAAAGTVAPRRLLLAVGGNETAEFQRQQADFAAAWQQRGWPLQVIEQPGEDHFSIMNRFAEAGSPLFKALAHEISAGFGR